VAVVAAEDEATARRAVGLTVLLDGRPVNSCLVLAATVGGRVITTVEGLARGDQLHPLQSALIREGAVQCGYCTPGVLMSASALLERNPFAGEREVKEALSGNLCRCTGYKKIIKGVLWRRKLISRQRYPERHSLFVSLWRSPSGGRRHL
jgi:aerobic-type carbon monoxide dehydrogenase small subunit (CoxS/CutS family)